MLNVILFRVFPKLAAKISIYKYWTLKGGDNLCKCKSFFVHSKLMKWLVGNNPNTLNGFPTYDDNLVVTKEMRLRFSMT